MSARFTLRVAAAAGYAVVTAEIPWDPVSLDDARKIVGELLEQVGCLAEELGSDGEALLITLRTEERP